MSVKHVAWCCLLKSQTLSLTNELPLPGEGVHCSIWRLRNRNCRFSTKLHIPYMRTYGALLEPSRWYTGAEASSLVCLYLSFISVFINYFLLTFQMSIRALLTMTSTNLKTQPAHGKIPVCPYLLGCEDKPWKKLAMTECCIIKLLSGVGHGSHCFAPLYNHADFRYFMSV